MTDKPRFRGDAASMMSALQGGPAMFAPSLMGRFGLPMAGPGNPAEAFDAPWSTYKGLGVSIDKGVATLEVVGPLGFKLGWSVGYDEIHEVIEARVKPNADALLLNFHTPGGLVSGCFDCVDYIHSLKMPVVAVVSDYCASAGYALASAADEIVITQNGMAGSIGVVMTHMDYSKQAEAMGVGVTYIYAGDEKVLGAPYKSLSDSDRAALQAEVDVLYSSFVDKVVRGRPMTEEQVRDTQAGLFMANDAKDKGLADRVMNPYALLKEMQQGVMSGTLVPSPTRLEAIMPTAEGLPASEAEYKEALATARAEGVASASTKTPEKKADGPADDGAVSAAQQERERIRAITSSDAAKTRPKLAESLAMDSGMSLEDATKVLEAAAEESTGEQPAEQTGLLGHIMKGYDHGISPEGGDTTPEPTGAVKLKPLGDVYSQRRIDAGHA